MCVHVLQMGDLRLKSVLRGRRFIHLFRIIWDAGIASRGVEGGLRLFVVFFLISEVESDPGYLSFPI